MNVFEIVAVCTPILVVLSNLVVGKVLMERIKQQDKTIGDLKIYSDIFNPDKIKSIVEMQSDKTGHEKANKIIEEFFEGKNLTGIVTNALVVINAELYRFIALRVLEDIQDPNEREYYIRSNFQENSENILISLKALEKLYKP